MSEDHYLLNHLDAPVKFLIFSLDESLAFGVPFFVGIMIEKVIVCTVIGCMFYQILKRIKVMIGGMNMLQFFYWYLPTKEKMLKIYFPSYIRELKG